MIDARAYDDMAAMVVFRDLDAHDLQEASLVRGARVSHLRLFAEWTAVQANAVLSLVLYTAPDRTGWPFAVLALANTGQAGVAQAALLARNHRRFARSLAEAGVLVRARMPAFCAERGIHRIEARAWSDHPTAPRFLTAMGFRAECAMPGFGASGSHSFVQFAWVAGQ